MVGSPLSEQQLDALTKDLASIASWADEVVAAWLERRDGKFVCDLDWLYLSACTEGRSITEGECLVTRAGDGFLALVNGRRYRHPSYSTAQQAIEGALARRNVPGFVVRPPAYGGFISAEKLDLWYPPVKVWQDLSANPRAYIDRYLALADDLVDCFLGEAESTQIFDGYYYAYAERGKYIDADYECIAARAPLPSCVALVSTKRYRRWSHTRSLRDTVRIALEHRGVPVVEVQPRAGQTRASSLVQAWEARRLRLVSQ